MEIGPRNKLLAIWCVVCSEEWTCRDARAVDGAGNSSGAATRDRAEREILHINGILCKHLRSHFSQHFFPSPHLTLYGPLGAMILPSRHGRGANGRRIGGHGSCVAIVRSAAAAASSCVLPDGQATVCAMDLRALEEWGKGKGEKGGRGSCERRTTTVSQSSNYTRTRRAQKINSQR